LTDARQRCCVVPFTPGFDELAGNVAGDIERLGNATVQGSSETL
jgi:hypothetical protein